MINLSKQGKIQMLTDSFIKDYESINVESLEKADLYHSGKS